MPMCESEAAVRAVYRINSLPSWRVERLYGDEWRVVSYCGSREAAERALESHIARAVRWRGLTPEQRMREVLR